MECSKKRVTVKHNCPNPLFEQWLTEWRDKAKEQDSKMQYCFSLALKTLKKYPLPLETGKDCKILKGFGEKLCGMLDEKLRKYRNENNSTKITNSETTKPRTTTKVSDNKLKKTSPRAKKDYIPQKGSGAYAILLALHEKSLEPEFAGFSTKNEIIKQGQCYCDVSFTKPLPECRYTGWSSMKILLEKNLVEKHGNPARFRLTNEGSTLAEKLYILQKVEEFQKQEENEFELIEKVNFDQTTSSCSRDRSEGSSSEFTNLKQCHNKHQTRNVLAETQGSTASASSSNSTHETVILAPNSFEIILLVDTQELNGSKGDPENDQIILELKSLNVRYEIRNLKVGDYTWICRGNFGNELVLPYIIERKRMDDFGQSIKDNRFHEQKFRLKQSGIPNLIYLIESIGRNEHVGLPINTLYQAATNTLIHDGFSVKFTDNWKASCQYLACLTKFLEHLFKEKTLVSCPKEDLPQLLLDEDLIPLMLFKEFNKSSSKSRRFKVSEMFVRQLLQIKGMSVDKALAVVEKYSTPSLLKLKYEETEVTQRERLLSNIQYGTLKKNVGPVLSRTEMDARVNDFLNEINEIAPLNENKPESVWEKCYDEESGYYYYWNTKTNEVTWDMPSEYKAHHKVKTKKSSLYVPPRTAPLFPSTSILPPVSEAIKIYKIGECTDSLSNLNTKTAEGSKSVNKNKTPTPKSDLEEKKVVLISAYGDSESEEETSKENQVNGSETPLNPNRAHDILTKIQMKSTERKKLDSVSKQIEQSRSKSPVPFSLVAGYSDSEEESEPEPPKNHFPIIAPPPEENKVSYSTLFPAVNPIDIKDFEEPPNPPEEDFDSKAFQRKKRIGVALVNTGKKSKGEEENERKGLGFSSSDTDDSVTAANTYGNFKSGGVMFIKADILNPPQTTSGDLTENSDEKSEVVLNEIEEIYTTLKEKLGFLSEGREAVSPVQVMMIQLETLHIALKSGNLKQNYLKKWLEETCSDLIKLEKETTPEGWLLQWDRNHKRYYYQNATTGESQWEYPQADVTVCDEAMDICTTPPPNGVEATIHLSPPLPPVISSPSPPPPPSISDSKTNNKKSGLKDTTTVNIAPEKYDSNGEPLPPGIDSFDVSSKNKNVKNDMTDVLNSFYNDIAAIETGSSSPVPNSHEEIKETTNDAATDATKKKKKTKVKLAQGIAMKKKGVSKLVEKWKNVQMSYND